MRVLSSFSVIALAVTSHVFAGCAYDATETSDDPSTAPEHVGQSQAAVCSGSCDGEDPHTTGCDADGVVEASNPIKTNFGVVVGEVYVFYSARCGSSWAQTTSTSNNYLVARITRASPYATYYGNNASSGPGTIVHSPMVTVSSGTTVTAKGDVEPVAGGDYFATASHTF